MIKIDDTWSLFLDRDGVINHKIPNDYVKNYSELKFINGTLESLSKLSQLFKYIFIVTNQQGIGKGIMTVQDLETLHNKMLSDIEQHNAQIDKIYYCPELAIHNPNCRKPNIGMALQAKKDFPDIDFKKSVMVGDSISDMEFANNAGIEKAVFINNDYTKTHCNIDYTINNLKEIMSIIIKN